MNSRERVARDWPLFTESVDRCLPGSKLPPYCASRTAELATAELALPELDESELLRGAQKSREDLFPRESIDSVALEF
jgi:hypothetical protein